MQLIITVDAEADNQWDRKATQTVANLAAVPRFQRLCEEHGFPPTYLCTQEVATSPAFERTIGSAAADGRAEVGAHLHPWTTPPFDPEWDVAGTFPSELPSSLLREKLATLTSTLRERTGRSPTSYRAGRWGFSPPQIPMLTALGYEVDCSVTPGVSWRGDLGLRKGGSDFTTAPVAPYELAADDPCRPGSSGLLEVPVTILHTSRVLRACAALHRRYRRRRPATKTTTGRFAPRWLRPGPHVTAERLIAVADTARALGLPVLEMMLHSSELWPGASPSTPTAEAVDRMFARLSRVLGRLTANGVTGVTLTAFARAYRKRLGGVHA